MNVQIEVTTRCNLSCSYCVRNFWNVKPLDTSLETFREILDYFDADRVTLYGFGEPTIHENFEEMLKIAQSKSEVLVVTNGLNIEKFADKIDILAISVRELDSETKSLLKDLNHGNLYASIILTKDNLSYLLSWIEWLCSNGINIFLTNMVPYNREIFEKTLFVCTSKKAVEMCEKIGDLEEFLKSLIYLSPQAVKTYMDLSSHCPVNIGYVIKNKDRISEAMKVESLLSKAKDLAEDYGVEIHLPNMFADERRCPYVDYIFVRADGKISPCMDLAYTHQIYPGFEGTVSEFAVEDVDELGEFMKKRKNMDNFPWCCDCQFAIGCWYIDSEYDCYGNYPSCSLCLYSAGIARCLI